MSDTSSIDITIIDNRTTPSTPRVEVKTNYDSDEHAGKVSQILFFLGIILPFMWVFNCYYYRSKSKVAYRWRRFGYIGLCFYISIVLVVIWIGLVVSFNLWRWNVTKVNEIEYKTKHYYVYDGFTKKMKMEIGEFICLLFGPVFIAIVLYDVAKGWIIHVATGGICRDIQRMRKKSSDLVQKSTHELNQIDIMGTIVTKSPSND